MIKHFFIFSALLIFATGYSQDIKKYEWDQKPEFETVPAEYEKEQAVILLDRRWAHTSFGDLKTFNMNHLAVKINTADAINKYNKVKAEDNGYIRSVKDFHARLIKPNGEIKILPEESIVETEIDKVKSIVFEGVGEGDILEYYFILKEYPRLNGVEVFQREIPVLHSEFIISGFDIESHIYPHEAFVYSLENSIPGFTKKHTYRTKNIPALKEEVNSKKIPNLVKVIYNIHQRNYDPAKWNWFFFESFKKPTFNYFKKSKAEEFINQLNLRNLPTDEAVTKLDLYIKENFDFVWKGEKAKKIKNLNDGKLKLTASDIFDLYGFILKELKISYNVVTAMDRFYGKIDEDRYVTPLPHEFMYYIQETKKFVSPYEKYLSYGNPMYEVQNTRGLGFNTYSKHYDMTYIDFPVIPADYTINETTNTVTLNEDLATAKIDKVTSNTGYLGQIERYYSKYLKENEEEDEILEYLKKRTINGVDVKIIEYSFENQEYQNNYSNTPLVTKLKIETKESITENAGNLLLVNLGKAIGKQNNLYQENERKTDIDLMYNKSIKHKIIFNIPEGYEVESFKDLLIDKTMNYDADKTCWFKSVAKIEANKLIVEVDEKYQSITYPKENYQEYRKVVNAAADFNKATVVLKQKQQ